MRVNLVALCTEETKVDVYNNVCPLVQNKLNSCTVEVVSTTVFCDLYAINTFLKESLGRSVVIVGDFANNIDIKMLSQILIERYNATLQQFEAGYYIANNNVKCLVVDTSKFNFYDYLVPKVVCQIFGIIEPVGRLKIFGLDKTSILQRIASLDNSGSFVISVNVSYLDGEIVFAPKPNATANVIQSFIREIYEAFNDYFYTDNDETMLEALDEILSVRNAKVAFADIFTKGYLEQYLREGLPNFEEHITEFYSLNTLEDVANQLGVGTDFLATHQKDSVDLCYEMGATLAEDASANVCVVLSGTYKIPFLGLGDNQAIHVYKYNFDHSADYITKIMSKQAIFKIIKKLRENHLSFLENGV